MPKAAHNLSLDEGDFFSDKKPANTGKHIPKSHSLERKLESGGRFTRSSRKNPCPICDRTKDDKCAWNSQVIPNCYVYVSILFAKYRDSHI